MTSDVVSVRQNLDLLVNNSKPVPGLRGERYVAVGRHLGNAVYVSRSGLGVTADGALVYVGGPGLNITDLANLSGACRRGSRHGTRYQRRLGQLLLLLAVDSERLRSPTTAASS